MASNNPDMRDLLRIVESVEEVIFESEEKLLYPPTVFDGEGNEHPYDIYHDYMKTKEVGDIVRSHAAAPGYGYTDKRITRMDDTGIYGVMVKNTVRELEPWMVEDSTDEGFELEYDAGYGVYKAIIGDQVILTGTADYKEAQHEAEAMMQDQDFYEGNKPYAGKGGEPYATMTDGPDKYLFRKDQKQKLVGSADNEPEDGEEELEENRFQYEVDGYGYNEEEDHPIDEDDPRKKWHYMTTPEGERVTLDHSPYEEMDKNEFAAHVAAHRKGTMENYIREMQIAAGIIVAEDDTHRKGAGETECKYCSSKDCDYDCDESQAGGFAESINEECDNCREWDPDDQNVCPECYGGRAIEEDCPTDPEENADGECSPITHTPKKEIDEEDFIEDLLLAPEDPAGPEVDEDDYSHLVSGEDQLSARSDRDMSDSEPFGDDYPMDEGPDSEDPTAMECPGCGDIAMRVIGKSGDDDEMECENCGAYGIYASLDEQGPGEFDYDPDAMVDVGDKEDYEKYDFDREFEDMLGGSSDPVGNYGAGSMYEMNEIRRLAGMEPIEEKKADKDFDGDGKVESEEDEYKGSKDKAIKKELDEGEVDEGYTPGRPKSSVIGYDVADEKAYYVMADLLGAELDFGPEDEILVPVDRNDQIIAALTDHGFVDGEDYRVAGQMFDDLQNGYNDRAFTKGQDYFPKGAQSTPASDLGPSASGMADNPMSNKMRMVKKDNVYENMKLAYRRHRKA